MSSVAVAMQESVTLLIALEGPEDAVRCRGSAQRHQAAGEQLRVADDIRVNAEERCSGEATETGETSEDFIKDYRKASPGDSIFVGGSG